MKKENQVKLGEIKKRGLSEAHRELRRIQVDLEKIGYPDLAEELDFFIDKVVQEVYQIKEDK